MVKLKGKMGVTGGWIWFLHIIKNNSNRFIQDNCRFDEDEYGIIWPSIKVGEKLFGECSNIKGKKLKGILL